MMISFYILLGIIFAGLLIISARKRDEKSLRIIVFALVGMIGGRVFVLKDWVTFCYTLALWITLIVYEFINDYNDDY